MTGPGQSLSVTLSRCSLRPSLAAIRAASCDLLALLPGLRIHATVIAHGISDWISTGSLRQCFNILPRALSGSRAALCALRSTVPAHAGCPHTVPAHNGPSLPCTSRLQCRCILRCKGARTRALSSRPPRGFLGARARSFSCTQAAARGSACPHPGPLQLRLLVLLKCNSFNRNTVLRDGRPKIGMTATPSRNRNRKHPAGTGP